MNTSKKNAKDVLRARLAGVDLIEYRRSQRKEKLQIFLQSSLFNIPIGILILVSIVLVFAEFLVHPGDVRDVIILANDIITWVFVLELSLRYYGAPNKKIFYKQYWIDILSVLPVLRFFRTFRILRLLRLVRLSRVALIFLRHGGWLSRNVERSIGSYGLLAVVSAFIIIGGTLATLTFELQPTDPTVSSRQFLERTWQTAFLFISGEIVGALPGTVPGRLISIIISLAGLSIFAIFVGTVSATMTTYLRNSMDSKDLDLKDLSGHIIICGWDSVCADILRELEAVADIWHKGVVVIADTDDDIVKHGGIKNTNRMFHVRDDFTKFDVLESVGAAKASRALVIADGSNSELSDQDRDARTVLAALTLEKINPNIFTCAELINEKNATHLKLAGVEEIISRARLTAGLFASTAVNDGVTAVVSQILTHHEGAYLRKITVPESFHNKPFQDLLIGFKQDFDSTVIALEKKSEGLKQAHVNPSAQTILTPGDRIVVLVTKDSLLCDL